MAYQTLWLIVYLQVFLVFFVEALYVSQKGCAVLVFLKLLNDVFVYSSFINKYSTAHAGTHT